MVGPLFVELVPVVLREEAAEGFDAAEGLLEVVADHVGEVLQLAVRRFEERGLLFEQLLEALLFGNVARDGIHQAVLQLGLGGPAEPAVGAVDAKVAVLESEDLGAAAELLLDFVVRPLHVVRVDEVEVRAADQLFDGEAGDLLPDLVHTLEVPVEAGDAEHVE